MNYQAINYEDEKLQNMYDLYERHNGKRNYVCDGDYKKIRVAISYDFVKVTFKKTPSKNTKSISNKKSSFKPWY